MKHPLRNLVIDLTLLFKDKSVIERLLLSVWLVIIALLPFHAFLSTWGGSAIGPLEVWKSWKEILLLAILLLALIYLQRHQQLREVFRDKLVLLIITYVLAHIITVGILQPDIRAASAAFLFNLRFLGMLLLSLVLLRFVNRATLLRVTLKIVLGTGLIVVMFGLLQVMVLPKDLLAHFGYSATTIAPYTTLNDNEAIIRAMSTLRGPNVLGQYLLLLGAVFLSLWRPNLRMFATGGILASLLLLYFTHSRSAWIGMAVMAFVFVWLSISNNLLRRRVLIGTIIGGIVGVGIVAISLPQSPALQNAILHTEIDDTSPSSTDAHWDSIVSSLQRIADHPFGTGPGTAGPASFYGDVPTIPENYYLQLIEEVGFIGLLLFLAICIVVIRRLYLQRSDMWPKILIATFAGVMAINLLLHGWADETMAMTWWAIAGLFMQRDLPK